MMHDKLKLSEYLESLQGTYEENMPWDKLIELAKELEQDLELVSSNNKRKMSYLLSCIYKLLVNIIKTDDAKKDADKMVEINKLFRDVK